MRLLVSLLFSGLITAILFMLMSNLVSASNNDALVVPSVDIEKPLEFDPLQEKIRNKPKKIKEPEKPEPMKQPQKVSQPTKVEVPSSDQLFNGFETSFESDAFKMPAFTQGEGNLNDSFGPKVMVEPSYPPEAAMKGLEGEVTLEFDVNSFGQVENVRVIAAKPKRVFSQAAMRAVSRWTFSPEKVDGKAIARKGERVTLTFNLDDA
ncbi:MAG: energy transducer TonB [Gammaproteobacteria bacterium]|nr:energy transducer TonB [Gammaproteobacteria bacterium]